MGLPSGSIHPATNTTPTPRPWPAVDHRRHAAPDEHPRLPDGLTVVAQPDGGRRRTDRAPQTYREFAARLRGGNA